RLGLTRVGQLLDLEVPRERETRMLRVVGLKEIEVLVAIAIGDEDDLRGVRRPGDTVVVGRAVGQTANVGLRADRHHEQFAVDGEGDVALVPREGVLGGTAGEGNGPLGVGLVVSIGLDGQAARGGAGPGRGDPQVGAAFVDDPLAVGTEAGLADAVLLVKGLATFVRRHEDRLAPGAVYFLPNNVGGAQDLPDIEERAARGGPQGRTILAVEGGELAVIGAVNVAEPDVVVGRTAVVAAIPRAGAAHVGDAVAARRIDAFAALSRGDATSASALDRDAVQLVLRREAGTARRGE